MTDHETLDARVSRALTDLRPAMEADGGGVELVSVIDCVATVSLTGTCIFCPSQQLSASALRRRIIERVQGLEDVRVCIA